MAKELDTEDLMKKISNGSATITEVLRYLKTAKGGMLQVSYNENDGTPLGAFVCFRGEDTEVYLEAIELVSKHSEWKEDLDLGN